LIIQGFFCIFKFHLIKEREKDMITNKQKALINDCYDRLNVLNDVTWTRYRDDLFKMERKSERDHRKCRFDGREYSKRAISINDSARYFACKHILDALVQEPPSVKGFLSLKRSIFYGHSLVANYRTRIERCLTVLTSGILKN